MPENELELSWTPDLFIKAVNAVVSKMDAIEAKMGDIAGATTKMEKHGAMAIGAWTAIMTKSIDIISSGIRKALEFIPEIGHSFQVASDIVLRNLLWPLRQELIPILQSMLNWVRDNRAMFVRWGMVIANVFRMIKQVVVTFFEMAKNVWQRFTKILGKFFGDTGKSITDVLNLLLFRITVLVVTAQSIIEPVLNTLLNVWEKLANLTRGFFEGLMKGARGMSEPIDEIVTSFRDFLEMIDSVVGGTDVLYKAFHLLGTFLGTTVKVSLEAIAQTLDTIVFSAKFLKALFSGDTEAMKGLAMEFGGRAKQRGIRAFETVNESAKELGSAVTGGDTFAPTSNKSTSTTVHQEINITARDANETGEIVRKKTTDVVTQRKNDAMRRGDNNPGSKK